MNRSRHVLITPRPLLLGLHWSRVYNIPIGLASIRLQRRSVIRRCADNCCGGASRLCAIGMQLRNCCHIASYTDHVPPVQTTAAAVTGNGASKLCAIGSASAAVTDRGTSALATSVGGKTGRRQHQVPLNSSTDLTL